jgi:hypothetical protein
MPEYVLWPLVVGIVLIVLGAAFHKRLEKLFDKLFTRKPKQKKDKKHNDLIILRDLKSAFHPILNMDRYSKHAIRRLLQKSLNEIRDKASRLQDERYEELKDS